MSSRGRGRGRKPPRGGKQPRGFFMGKRIFVNPDPPSINTLAVLDTTLGITHSGSTGFEEITTQVIRSNITSLYGWPIEGYNFSVMSIKVWLLAENQQLIVQFFDPDDGGVLQEITDFGAPTRYACVGYQCPIQMAATPLNNAAVVKLLAYRSSVENPRVLMRFSLRIRFKALA